ARAPASRQVVGRQGAPADPLDAHDHALVGIRAADQVVALQPVALRQVALLGRQERQHRLQRVQAEVAALGEAPPARLGEVEVVADLEAADGAPVDPLDRHPQVVQVRRVGHQSPSSSTTASSSTSSSTPSGMKPSTYSVVLAGSTPANASAWARTAARQSAS